MFFDVIAYMRTEGKWLFVVNVVIYSV